MPRTPINLVRLRLLRGVGGHWSGDVVDLDEPSARWLIEHGEAEPAPPGLDLTTGGRAFTRPELLADPEPPPRSRPRRSA